MRRLAELLQERSQERSFKDLLNLLFLRYPDAKPDPEPDPQPNLRPPREQCLFLPHSHCVLHRPLVTVELPRWLVGVGQFLRVRIATVVVLGVAVVVRIPVVSARIVALIGRLAAVVLVRIVALIGRLGPKEEMECPH